MAPPSIVPASARGAVVRPFPWGTLASLSRDQVGLAAGFARMARATFEAGVVQSAVAGLAHAEVRFSLRGASAARLAADVPGSLAFVVERADDPSWRVIVEAERDLALAVTARALGRPAPRVAAADLASPRSVAGAFAAVATTVLRRARGASPLRVLTAGTGDEVWAEANRYPEELAVAELTAWIDDDAFVLRVAVPRDLVARASAPARAAIDLARLGDVPLTMPVVASIALGRASEVTALRPGDAWMPGNVRLARRGDGRLAGPVLLAAPHADVGVTAEIGEDGRVVVRGEREDMSMAEAIAGEGAGELPVVVRVEVGSVELRAREWAALGPGDVVTLGRRVGAPVVLRVGGLDVARGELVEVEGEIGVRIVAVGDGR